MACVGHTCTGILINLPKLIMTNSFRVFTQRIDNEIQYIQLRRDELHVSESINNCSDVHLPGLGEAI